jgi:pimeloyl-ACP methyl ester carboxylesterase
VGQRRSVVCDVNDGIYRDDVTTSSIRHVPRRLVIPALVVIGVLAAVAVRAARARTTSMPPPVADVFANSMAYSHVGTGSKTAIVIPGGPGNSAPSARMMRATASWYRLFTDAGYTVWNVTRKRGMPRGHGMPEIADDYAELIEAEFGGRVDLVVGISMGGEIALELAARHPQRVGAVTLVASAARLSDEGRAADLEFARLIEEGRPGEALAAFVPFMAPDVPAPLGLALARVIGPIMFRESHPDFVADVVVEAHAEARADASAQLSGISVPVLVAAGDDDRFFPVELIRETAAGIPDAALRLYPGHGHAWAASNTAVAADVVAWAQNVAASKAAVSAD